MDKTQCMGCQTSFQDAQTVILQNLTTEYKNYQLPLKDDKAKWIILKTIVSFLNSQGGTIYIGIDDQKGTVQGLFMTRKQRDNFKLSMKFLIEKIHPKVDLNNKLEINIQFVPIVKNEQFLGKYIVKIIVEQGDPSSVYTFAEKIKLQGSNNKTEDYQIFYAYQRHNMAGTTEIKGVRLLNLIKERAKNPLIQSTTFHEGCNPEPPHLQISIHSIHFSNMNANHMKILQQTFDQNFQKADIDYKTQFFKDEKIIKLTIADIQDFKQVRDFIEVNVKYLNQQIFKEESVLFEVKGQCQHYFLIENTYEQAKKNSNKPKNELRFKQQKNDRSKEKPVVSQKMHSFNRNYPKEQRKIEIITAPKVQQVKINSNPNFPKKFCLTFTHIEPASISQLQAFLNLSIIKRYDKNFVRYFNTIEVFLKTNQQFDNYIGVVFQKLKQLQAFGFKQEIRFGINQGNLKILYFDKAKKQSMQQTLQNLIGTSLKSCEFEKQKNGNIMVLKFRQKSAACQYLDILLRDRDFKKTFGFPNNRNNNVVKMKIFLDVAEVL